MKKLGQSNMLRMDLWFFEEKKNSMLIFYQVLWDQIEHIHSSLPLKSKVLGVHNKINAGVNQLIDKATKLDRIWHQRSGGKS